MIKVCKWESFQHYNKPKPRWIKLYRDLLGDYNWAKLSVEDRHNLVCLWMLAAETNNEIPQDLNWLKLRMHLKKEPNLKPLQDNGFIELDDDSRETLDIDYRETLVSEEKRREEKRRGNKPLDFQAIQERWNSFAVDNRLPKVLRLSEKRKKHVKARAEDGMLESLDEIFSGIAKSSFLVGGNERGWSVCFDWLFSSSDNWLKIIEGKYQDKGEGAFYTEEQICSIQEMEDKIAKEDEDAKYQEANQLFHG